LTASAEVVKKIDSLVENWNELAEDLGLNDPKVKVMEIDYNTDPETGENKPGKISLPKFFQELGNMLKVVKDGVVTINTVTSQRKTPEMAKEPVDELPLEPDQTEQLPEETSVSDPGSASEIRKIADDIPAGPSF